MIGALTMTQIQPIVVSQDALTKEMRQQARANRRAPDAGSVHEMECNTVQAPATGQTATRLFWLTTPQGAGMLSGQRRHFQSTYISKLCHHPGIVESETYWTDNPQED